MSDFSKNIFAGRLRNLRGTESQSSYARRCGISQQNWNRYESGCVEPKMDALQQIATHAGVSVDWLMGATDERRPGDAAPPLVLRDGALYGDPADRGGWRYRALGTPRLRRMPQSELIQWAQHFLDEIKAASTSDYSRARNAEEVMHLLNELADRIYAGREETEKEKGSK